jgi:hypothetical protein
MGVSVTEVKWVLVKAGTGVDTTGVVLFTPITTVVGETTGGVLVAGRKGVGRFEEGWKNQPLHDVKRDIVRNTKTYFFISSPPLHSIPLGRISKNPLSLLKPPSAAVYDIHTSPRTAIRV